NDWPPDEWIAPRPKSSWPPVDDQYWLPSDSDAHWPRKSTSSVALIATMPAWRLMLRGSLVWSTGQNSTPGFSSTNRYRRALPIAEVVTILLTWSVLRVPVTTPCSTRSTNPSASSSVWMPRSRWLLSSLSTSLGTLPTPAC